MPSSNRGGKRSSSLVLEDEVIGGSTPPSAPVPPDRPNHRRNKSITSSSSTTTTTTTTETLLYKVMVLGESSVGKSSIIRSYSGHEFEPNLMYTIGIDYVNAYLYVDGISVHLQIWDTAGQERFRTLTQQYYRGTQGLLMVFDITNRRSFDLLYFWMSTLIKHNLQHIPVTLVGNKADLCEQREVSTAEGEEVFEVLAHDIKDALHPFLINAEELMSSHSSSGSHCKPISDDVLEANWGSSSKSVGKTKKRLSSIFHHSSSSSSGHSFSSDLDNGGKNGCC